jgi:hypothetical protein
MDIKVKIAELTKAKEAIDARILEQSEASKRLKDTIKKLQKKALEVDELLDSTPVLDEKK